MIALFQVPYARVVVLEVFEVRADVQTRVEKKHAFGGVYDEAPGGVSGEVPGDVPGEAPAEAPTEVPVEVPDGVFLGGHVVIFDAAVVVVVSGGVTEKDTDGQYVEDNAGEYGEEPMNYRSSTCVHGSAVVSNYCTCICEDQTCWDFGFLGCMHMPVYYYWIGIVRGVND